MSILHGYTNKYMASMIISCGPITQIHDIIWLTTSLSHTDGCNKLNETSSKHVYHHDDSSY